MIEALKVAAVATAMAVAGTLALFGNRPGNSEWLYGFLPKVVLVSNLLWLTINLTFRRRPPPLRWALELGAASPFLGAILLGIMFPHGFLKPYPGAPSEPLGIALVNGVLMYVMGVASSFWFFIPIGIATGYLVYRAHSQKARLA